MAEEESFRLKIGLDDTDARKQAKALLTEISNIFKSVSGKELSANFKNLSLNMSKAAEKAASIVKEMEALENAQLPTQEYKDISAQLEKAEKDLDKLFVKQVELQNVAEKDRNSAWEKSWNKNQEDIEAVGAVMRDARIELQQLVEDGKAFTLGKDSEEYKKLESDLANVNSQMDLYLTKIHQTDELKPNIDKAKEAFNNIGTTIKDNVKNMKRFALSALGVRGVFSMLMRAVNLYKSQNEDLAKKIQGIWNVIANAIGPVVEWLINLLVKLFGMLNAFIKALTGIDFIARANAKALKKQADAQKKLNAQTAAFDEMNKLSDNNSQDANTLKAPDIDLRDWAKNLGLDGISQTIENIIGLLQKLWNEVLVPLGQWVGNDLVPAFFYALDGAFKVLNEIWADVEPILSWLWNNFLLPVMTFVGNALVEFLREVGDMLAWIAENEGAIDVIEGMAIAIALMKLPELIKNIKELWTNFTGLFESGGKVAKLFTALDPKTALITVAIGLLVAALIWCIKHWDEIKEVAGKAWDWIKEKWSAAGTWFHNTFNPVFKWFNEKWTALKTKVAGVWDSIKSKASSVWSWIKEHVFSPLGQWFEDSFGSAWRAVKDLWENSKPTINSLLGGIESMVNGIIKGINAIINGLNKISFDVPASIPIIGGTKWGFNLKNVGQVTIPRLAQGAVIPPNKEFMAILGDQKQGTNIEAPLDTIVEAFRKVQGDNNQPIIVKLEVDGKVLAKATANAKKKLDFSFNGG